MSNKATIYKTKNLTIRYLIALFLIASLIVAAYILIRISLYEQTSDSLVINLSGRQRMLSQKLTKEVLLLVQSETPEMKGKYRELLRVTLTGWSKVHMGLQYGDEGLNLPRNNSQEVQNLFAEIEPYYRIIKSSADKILALRSVDLERLSIRAPLVNNIVEASSLYLEWMDRAVFQYDKEAQGRVDRLKRLETFILTTVLLLLSLEGLLIFRPMVSRVRRTYRDFQRAEILTKEQNERLKGLDRMKSEFLSTAAHELRTPLTSILGFSEILLKRKLDEERRNRFLKIINEESVGLANLINDLLDVSRIESGEGFKIKKAPIELREIIRENVNLFKSQTDKHTFEVNIPSSLSDVKGDKDKISNVMENLLANALKFSPQGGKVTVSAGKTKGKVTISVTDEGMGIPKKDLPHLFEKFYRAENASSQAIKGTGLGLSIAKYIIDSHAGEIWAESKLGEGSTFSFTLPSKFAQARIERKD